jgi:hypothetical protein
VHSFYKRGIESRLIPLSISLCLCVLTFYGMLRCYAAGWTIRVLGFGSRRGLGIYLFTTASRTALGSTQPPIKWVPRALSLGVKRPGPEADHSRPSSAEVKICVELYLHSLNTSSCRCAQLKHRDKFTFILPYFFYVVMSRFPI